MRVPAGILASAYLAAAALWLAAVVAAPWLASSLRRGDAGFLLAGIIYRSGEVICHQRPERSFHLAGVQLPVCARCTGLYAGAPLGAAVAAAAWRRRRPISFRVARTALLAGAVPTLALWVAERLGGLLVSNLARAAGAVPFGIAVSVAIVAAIVGSERDDRLPDSGVN
jgi:uncharacterized membrane protein